MFEFDKYRGPKSSPVRPERQYTPFAGAAERALLLWGEHCIECAAPDCFKTCDLYDPRPDRRCRRFVYGIYRNRAFSSANGYGAEVRFKKWGKLEARGNASVYRERHVRWMEGALALTSRAINPIGRVISSFSGDLRWSYLSFSLSVRLNSWLRRHRDPSRLPDSFVVEIYNPTKSTTVLTLSMSIDRSQLKGAISAKQLPSPLLQKLTVPPGHFLEIIPLEKFRAILESNLPFGIALTPQADAETHLVFLTLDFVRGSKKRLRAIDGGSTKALKPAKCVVFDLDNTLWDGILVEGSVSLRGGVSEVFRELDRRGILISVASKNAHDVAVEKLTELGLEEYLLFPSISWNPKSESLKRIAADLDLGLDSFLFIDDNAFEREEVGRALPMVETLPDSALTGLLDHPRLKGATTAESGHRRKMYRENMQRRTAADAFGDDYLAFLRSCNIEAEIRPSRGHDFDRIAELVQRTNQLNFSGHNYNREEISQLLADERLEKYVITVADDFGSYGMVGFCLASREGECVRVRDFMLSCRVQGRFVEQALFHHLTHRPEWTAEFIEIEFRRTQRNELAAAVMEKLGFEPGTNGLLCRTVGPAEQKSDLIRVTGEWPATEAVDLRALGP